MSIPHRQKACILIVFAKLYIFAWVLIADPYNCGKRESVPSSGSVLDSTRAVTYS